MIYVITNESGEYSDYNKLILFASSSKDLVEKKLEWLNSEHKKLSKVMEKVSKLVSEFKIQNPRPSWNKEEYDELSDKDKKLFWKKDGNIMSLHRSFQENKIKELSNLSAKDLLLFYRGNGYFYERGYYIEEVEELT